MYTKMKIVFAIKYFNQHSRFFKNIACKYSTVSTNSVIKNNIYSILNPYVDFEDRLKGKALAESIKERNLNIDLDNVVSLWNQYKQVEETKSKLERSREEIVEKIKTFSDPSRHKSDIEGLKIKGKIIRKDLKNTSLIFSDLEQRLLPQILRLPNDLEHSMYSKDNKSYFTPNLKSDHHLDIANKLNLITYVSPFAYFLKNEAAEFELLLTSSFFNFFVKNGFVPFSNPDFSRSSVIEGCSVNPDLIFTLQRNSNETDQFYLNGTASVLPFCSFHSRHVSKNVPVKYVSQGRHYAPICSDLHDGLYTICQSNAVQIFIGFSDTKKADEFGSAVVLLSEIYKQMNLPFRVVKIHPSQLELAEALKVSFQVHSPFKNKYIEVGNLSFYGEYISKKLRMYYTDNEKFNFMSVISGTVLKVPPLLGTFLENKRTCKIPEGILAYT
ncbi:serine--tRNA synthetase-like protein Slimp [Halyomorpha halys]|uniref:serine--tRNA synthetase-like protein Slimp n=1 Tax=Halyomorpha halys TaxID=286706 RepID=UPI0006D4D3AE|nr:uncharacterized protein LOC106685382 [Halyomorpha halys]